MVVRIRLARFGRAHRPIYNIVVAQARTARDSKPMEVLGTYNPLPQTPLASNDVPDSRNDLSSDPGSTEEGLSVQTEKVKKFKDIQLDITRTKYWLGVGAQPSESVERMFVMLGLMIPRPGMSRQTTVQSQSQATSAGPSSNEAMAAS